MRKISLLLSILLLAGLAAGCGDSGGSSAGSDGTPTTMELRLETLNVELPRTEDNVEELTAALQELPDALKDALAESDVFVDSIRVTVGTSTSATCQSLLAGNVDVAFLPAGDFAEYGQGDPAILGNGGEHAGVSVLLCAAPTEYGKNLSARVESGKDLTWDELNNARWGVVNRTTAADATAALELPGSEAVDLWLSDHYEGNTLSDLDHVTVYRDDASMVQAAADGEIDVFHLPEDSRETYAEVLPDIPVLAKTDALFTWVVAVTPENAELQSDAFTTALRDAVTRLCQEDSSRALVFGTDEYAVVSDQDLNAMRRLKVLNG